MKKFFVIFLVLGVVSTHLFATYTVEELEDLSEKISEQDVSSYSAAFEAAKAEIDNEDADIKSVVFELFYRLALQGQYLEEVFDIVLRYINDDNFCVRRVSLNLAEALIEQGVYLEEIYNFVGPCFDDAHYKVREAALQVVTAFVEAGHYYQEAFTASELMATNDKNPKVRKAALKVHDALMRKGQYHRLILENAQKELEKDNGLWSDAHQIILSSEERPDDIDEDADFCIENIGNDSEFWGDTLDYLNSESIEDLLLLIARGKEDSYPRAINAAKAAYCSPDACIRKDSLELYAALVGKGQAFEDAKKAAVRILDNELVNYYGESDDSDCTDFGEISGVVHAARDLLIALVKKGQAHDEAIQIAERCEYSDVFIALVEQGKGYEQAIKLLEKEYNDPDDLTEEYIPHLLIALANKDQVCDLALTWALKVINNYEINVSYEFHEYEIPRAIQVLIALIQNGHAYDDALEIAERLERLDLFTALIEQGQGFKQALNLFRNRPSWVSSHEFASGFIGALFRQQLIDAQEIYLLVNGPCWFEWNPEQFDDDLREALQEVDDCASRANNVCLAICNSSTLLGDLFIEDSDILAAIKEFNNDLVSDKVRLSLLSRIKSLVKKGMCYDEAFEVAQQAIGKESLETTKAGFKLLVALIKKGKAIQQILETAQVLTEHDDPQVKKYGWKLYHELANKGRYCNQIAAYAQQELGKKHGQWNKVHKILSLYKEDVQRGESGALFEEAFELFNEKGDFVEAKVEDEEDSENVFDAYD